MEVSQVVLEFKRRDLRGVGDFWWDTPSLGDGICFLGLGRILGVGIAYVTSFENFASFLFDVGAVSFIFRRRVAFLFCVSAAYVSCGEFLVDFPPLVLVQGGAETVVSTPLVLSQGSSFLTDCRRVGP